MGVKRGLVSFLFWFWLIWEGRMIPSSHPKPSHLCLTKWLFIWTLLSFTASSPPRKIVLFVPNGVIGVLVSKEIRGEGGQEKGDKMRLFL